MDTYDVVFTGEIKPDCDLQTTKQNIQSLLNLSDEDLELFFSGREVYLYRGVNSKDALTVYLEYENSGICVDVITEGEERRKNKIDRRLENKYVHDAEEVEEEHREHPERRKHYIKLSIM